VSRSRSKNSHRQGHDMNRKFGSLIRLIDIVLTLLFGFIMIADIEPYSRVALPQTRKESKPTKEEQHLFRIHVYSDGTFQVKGWRDNSPSKRSDWRDLDTYLMNNVAVDHNSTVIIKPADDSTVQQSITVLDLCIKHDIQNTALDLSNLKK